MYSTAYDLAYEKARMDMKKRGKKNLKDIKCKPGFELRGAVCQKKKKKKPVKLKKSYPLAQAALKVAIASATVGVGAGLTKATLSKTGQQAVNLGVQDLERFTKKKIPKNIQKEMSAVVSEVEKVVNKPKEKQPPLVQQVAKEALFQVTASTVGWAAMNVGFAGGSVGGVVGGMAATKSPEKSKKIGIGAATFFGTAAQIAARRRTLKALENKFGTGLQDPRARKMAARLNEVLEVSTTLGIGIGLMYADANQSETSGQSQGNSSNSNQYKQERGNFSNSADINKNWYKDLGVSKNASEEEIKKAYRDMARKHHPDLGGDEEKMKKINEAYEYYTKRIKRK